LSRKLSPSRAVKTGPIKRSQKSVDDGKLDNSALTLLANLTDTQARNVLRSNCLWLAQNIKDAEYIIAQRKEKNKKNTSLESLRKQVAAWKKENERAERIKNPAAPGEGEGEGEGGRGRNSSAGNHATDRGGFRQGDGRADLRCEGNGLRCWGDSQSKRQACQ
jgi:hypothetical protein